MKKNYLQIEIIRNEQVASRTLVLLTENVTAIIAENNETRVYLRNANPFSFIRLYIPNDYFFRLMKKQIFVYTQIVETSTFHYTLTEL